MNQAIKELKKHLNVLFHLFVTFLFSNRIKRLICLSSLTAVIVDTKDFDDETLHKLNELLGLCHYENAMKLPITLSDFIWNSKPILQIFKSSVMMDEHDTSAFAKTILEKLPEWLKYTDDDNMSSDIFTVLKTCRTMRMA